MKNFAQLLLGKFSHNIPKPFDDFMIFVIRFLVFSVFLPILKINLGNSKQYYFQLLWGKNGKIFYWKNSLNPLLYGGKTLFNHLNSYFVNTELEK